MALQGNLCDFSVTEILQLLGSQKKTGCLMLEWNTERAVVHVQDGRIVSTRQPGMGADDPLLTFLLKVHRLSDEQRRGLQTIHKESGRDLEDLLLNGRYLEPEELAVYLERQILDDLMRMVRWENGTYRFDPKLPRTIPPLVRLSLDGALIEAARRIDEQKRFVTRFKDPHQLLGVRDLPDPDEPLMEEEKELFGIIDGHHTVAQVVEAASLSEYEAYEALSRLLDAQWIEVVGRRAPGIASVVAPAKVAEVPSPRRRTPIGIQLLAGAFTFAAAIGLPFAARMLRTPPSTEPVEDVFATAQLHQIDLALDLYRRQTGAYPRNLEVLIDDDWITSDQTQIPGYRLSYRPSPDRQEYRLALGATQ
ncbi:MAG TPA: DUF4388 domain-containing protein [Candidatus Eisenbacteria bacterium]|jgi:hypothetical protein